MVNMCTYFGGALSRVLTAEPTPKTDSIERERLCLFVVQIS